MDSSSLCLLVSIMLKQIHCVHVNADQGMSAIFIVYGADYTVDPVFIMLLNFNIFLKTCVLTFIIITILQCTCTCTKTYSTQRLLLLSAHHVS